MSTRAILRIDGQKFRVLKASYAFSRQTDQTGYGSGNVRFNHMDFMLESDKTGFFLQWMFKPALQKSGTLSFYEEDGIKKIKQLIFGGAFCIDFREDFRSVGSTQMATMVRISAGGVRVEESKFKFPWFKGPLEPDIEAVSEVSVEYTTPAVQANPEPIPEEPPKRPDPPKNVIAENETEVSRDPDRKGKAFYYLTDLKTKAFYGTVKVPFGTEGGPELDLFPHEACKPNGAEIELVRGEVPITIIALRIAIKIFETQNGVPPKELPGQIIKKNLENWQREYIKVKKENENLTDQEAGKLAAERISFGRNRIKLKYSDVSVVKMEKFEEVEIDGIKYSKIPTLVYLTAKKP